VLPPADLAEALATALGALEVQGLERLSGGASRETWRFDIVAGGSTPPPVTPTSAARPDPEPMVLRRDPPGRPSVPGMMAAEAAAFRVCAAAGLRVPEVVLASELPSPWETAGIVMRRVEGETLARRILRDDAFAGRR
jgi:aminoglycoside phosphotransferase (APT) family kinase protein